MSLPTPYRDAAPTYRAAGWAGVLPIPYGSKRLLAKGWTGHGGAWPSNADVHAWCENDAPDEGGGNIALRLPPDVIGIDVDAYAGKTGRRTLEQAIAKWGELPLTWTSSARDDGISGIRLYRVPDGLRWPGQLGEHVELIQVGHRYLVVWPSVHPDTGGRYRWTRPDGLTSTVPPTPDDLPALPEAWVAALTRGELAEDATQANLAAAEIQAWIVAHHRGAMCHGTRAVLAKLLDELHTGSAHEALRRTFGLARLAEQGHAGFADALVQTRAAFIAEVTRAGRRGSTRTAEDAEQEFRRSLAGAVRRVVGSPSVGPADEAPVDPCADPFDALVDWSAVPAPPPSPPPLAGPPPPAAQMPAEQSAPGPAGTDTPSGVFAADGDTWRRRDLSAARRGSPVRPTLLTRSDGHALFYPGKINALIGESESGKTWVALAAVAQEIDQGHHVVYVDFEDTDRTLVQRLDALGCDPQLVDELVAYISPEETLTPAAAEVLAVEMARGEPTLAVLDGVNAAMARLGLDSNSTTDATRFAQVLLARLVAGGAGVVTIDHVSKNKETRGKGGIGSQAKRAMISGCAIAAEVVQPFGRGMTGEIRLVVDKDRHGGVREHAAYGKNVGTAVLRSSPVDGSVSLTINAKEDKAVDDSKPFRPTYLMQKVSGHLAHSPDGLSQSQIEREVDGRATGIRQAIAALEAEGFIERKPREGRGGGYVFVHKTRYQPNLDELVDTGDEDDEQP